MPREGKPSCPNYAGLSRQKGDVPMKYEPIHPNGILLVAAHSLLATGRTVGFPEGRHSVAGVENGEILVDIIDGDCRVLWEGRGVIMDEATDDGGAVLVFPDHLKLAPRFSRPEEIRAEVARLEGELSRLSGEPLVIWDERGRLTDLPEGGATIQWSPPAGTGFLKWYPTTDAARAALLAFAREHGCVPDADGWHVDISPETAQFSNDAWVTRR